MEQWKLSPRWIALLAVTAAVLHLCWLVIHPLIEVILWAAVLAIAAHPVHLALRARGHSPALSAVFTTSLVLITVLLPLSFVVTTLVGEVAGAADDLESGLRKLLDPIQPVVRAIDRLVDIDPYLNREFLSSRLKSVAGAVASGTLSLLGSLLDAFIKGFIILFAVYYLLRDHERVVAAARDFLPLSRSDADAVLRRCHEVITASMYGVLIIAALQGILAGVGFWIVGISKPLVWGAVMVLFAMIPMVGSAIIWLPAAIYLFATGHWIKGMFLVLWGSLVVAMVDNLLRPRLVGGRTRMHELVVFFSVIGGLQVFGFLGLVVGPVVMALATTLIDVFRRAGTAHATEAT